MKNPPFDSLVWGSLRLAPITIKDQSGGTYGTRGQGFMAVSKQTSCYTLELLPP